MYMLLTGRLAMDNIYHAGTVRDIAAMNAASSKGYTMTNAAAPTLLPLLYLLVIVATSVMSVQTYCWTTYTKLAQCVAWLL